MAFKKVKKFEICFYIKHFYLTLNDGIYVIKELLTNLHSESESVYTTFETKPLKIKMQIGQNCARKRGTKFQKYFLKLEIKLSDVF